MVSVIVKLFEDAAKDGLVLKNNLLTYVGKSSVDQVIHWGNCPAVLRGSLGYHSKLNVMLKTKNKFCSQCDTLFTIETEDIHQPKPYPTIMDASKQLVVLMQLKNVDLTLMSYSYSETVAIIDAFNAFETFIDECFFAPVKLNPYLGFKVKDFKNVKAQVSYNAATIHNIS